MEKLIGVTQAHCGHEYRWIFKSDVIARELDIPEDEILDNSGEMLYFPMGGSNASVTWFEELANGADDVDACNFLTTEGEGPDVDDPMLVDIAEYLVTIETDCGSCTEEILRKFNLNKEALTQTDDLYKRYAKSEKMIKDLKAAGYEDFDYERPFYGDNSDMRYSELVELWEKVTVRKE